ncbi:flagellar basal body rod protein FlgB [Desulfohalovibrio reitneri]|uniref:flagellar basal body rod protein FlgB n=1 Tax=Desulfohalovibrio reitneri TaxID=1307759 RepID=UPI0004A6D05F|nr:flagellar basal body rod protein FlgB [Desulfohalovibrio reitneri]
MKLFTPYMNLMHKAMDLRLERQNLVMGNLANITTPGYQPREIHFEKELQNALNQDAQGRMTRTNGEHMPSKFDPTSFDAAVDKGFDVRVTHGEDQVDLDKEMATMQKNAMQYNTLATLMKKHFDGLTKIIMDGSK